MGKKRDEHSVAPVIRVAPLGELRVYTVTEDELDALGRGAVGSVFLNFGLALVPLALSFLVTLLSTDIPSVAGKIFFIAGGLVFAVAGLICLALARVHHVSTRSLVDRIKNRMPPVPIPAAPPDPAPPSA